MGVPSHEAERPLPGGNVNDAVVRIGDTVRRAAGPHSATVQRLLAHVRELGVTWVPRPLGFDESGREVLGYIPGEVAHGEPDFRADAGILTGVATALRQWHDATVTFARGDGDVWFPHERYVALAGQEGSATTGELPGFVIAHNDFAPYNHVLRSGRFVGAIDFDACYPASREWDLAWTLYRYVLLPGFAPPTPAVSGRWPDLDSAQAARIAAECAPSAALMMDAYGGMSPDAVLAVMPARLLDMASWCAAQDSMAHREWGHMYAAHARWAGAIRAAYAQ